MFLGEALCIVVYPLIKENIVYQKPKPPVYLLCIPGFLDIFSSGLAYVSLNMISGSVWQISRGGVIITTAIFTRVFLRKHLNKSMIIGCFLALIGITGVELVSVLTEESSSSD